jgi:transcription elongation factor Elf1
MRRKPYTKIGIRRLRCLRCGRPAVHQWQICADGNVYRPICQRCDLALNDLVMRFMRLPDREEKLARYRKKLSEESN